MSDAPADRPEPPVAPPDAVHLVSGLVVYVVRPGEDDQRPGPRDVVRASYRAWTASGRFLAEAQAAKFPVDAMGPGPAEALQLIGVGGRIRVWLAANMTAAGPGDTGDEAGIYEIELESLTRTEEPPTIPPELRSPRLD